MSDQGTSREELDSRILLKILEQVTAIRFYMQLTIAAVVVTGVALGVVLR